MDFEEGEYNPAITAESGAASNLSATRKGYYTRIGDIVHVTILIEYSSWNSGPTGNVFINLPFTVKATYSFQVLSICQSDKNVTHTKI